MSRARLVTFEGIEGSGKTTQLEGLARRLRAAGVAVVVTREPGGTELGRGLRGLLLRPDEGREIDPRAELLLYAADRLQHLVEVVEPALAGGSVVLCDRYLDATLAYQGYGRGIDLESIRRLHCDPPLDRRPDRTVLLDIDERTGLSRARARDLASGVAATEGRFEREALGFHRRVRQGYLELAAAEPTRVRVVDGRGSAATVEARVLEAVRDLFASALGGAS